MFKAPISVLNEILVNISRLAFAPRMPEWLRCSNSSLFGMASNSDLEWLPILTCLSHVD